MDRFLSFSSFFFLREGREDGIQNEFIPTKCDESKEDSGKHGGKNEASRMADEGRKEEGRVRTEWRFVPGFSESIRRNKWRKGGRRVVD